VRSAHFVVPDSIDDPARPSGGNVYDRKVIQALTGDRWQITEHAIGGSWPHPGESDQRALAETLARIPDDSIVMIDGLLASAAASVVVPAAGRLRVVVLMHLPLGNQPPGHEIPRAREQERAILAVAAAVVTTSEWTRGLLLRTYDDLRPLRVHVATPGVVAARLAPGTAEGGQLLCVAAVTRHKGLDLLLDALSTLTELSWQCTCVGVLDREPEFVAELQKQAADDGLGDRIVFTGPLIGDDLARCYASADLLVLPSRGETYGMVVAEALAHGLPVIATAVGGVPDTIGHVETGDRPGLLIPAEDSSALADAIRRWLDNETLRVTLRHAAAHRRSTLASWSSTAAQIAGVLAEVAA
jgi:glycosyltransferase involved in cell wall biosynthesis